MCGRQMLTCLPGARAGQGCLGVRGSPGVPAARSESSSWYAIASSIARRSISCRSARNRCRSRGVVGAIAAGRPVPTVHRRAACRRRLRQCDLAFECVAIHRKKKSNGSRQAPGSSAELVGWTNASVGRRGGAPPRRGAGNPALRDGC
jgi:hypothetical protein